MSNHSVYSVKGFAVHPETLEQLPPLYREIANILIKRGEWTLITTIQEREPCQ